MLRISPARIVSLKTAFGIAALLVLCSLGLICQQMPGSPAGSGTAASPAASAVLQQVRFEQHLNAQVPLNTLFRDESGRTLPLQTFFGSRPVVLTLVYYRCTMLCSEVLTGLTSSLTSLKLNPGSDFNVVIVSFDPHDSPAVAASTRSSILKKYRRAGTEAGWHFLTGDEASIRALADITGFRYVYDSQTNQFAHPTGVVVLTPEGRIAQYYFGIEFSPRDLRLGFVEASHHRVGNLVDEVTLYCYHYDPTIGRYGAVVMNMVRLGGVAVLLALIGFIVFSLRNERKQKARVVVPIDLDRKGVRRA
jgi:protein SCO1/2